MRLLGDLSVLALAVSTLVAAGGLKARNFETHDYYTLQLRSGESPEIVARALGLAYEGTVGELPDHFYFSARRGTHDVEEKLERARNTRRKRELPEPGLEGILWSKKQQLRQRIRKRLPPPQLPERQQPTGAGVNSDTGESTAAVAEVTQLMSELAIADPTFRDQWHLFNTIEVGHDVNISGVWKQGIFGQNTTVALVDDGLDMYSDDLKANYYAEGSYDFNEHSQEPRPRLADDHHGTRCAGEVAAVKNDVCGVGVAWESKVAGIRILSAPISDEDEAAAINYEMQKNQIYSCSWGPPDDGMSMDAPDLIIKKAMQNGIQNGRSGLGSIFVFASGNGAASGDNCNFDGYTNSIYSITVGAVDRAGKHPYYSEKCSASLVVTYSSGGSDFIHTTDVGVNSCASTHGGTSAAAPLGAGIFALALGVRPELTWRDMQYLVVNTAVPVNLDDEDGWQDTYAGHKYSHTFAYGKLDAYGLVEMAKTWQLVKPQAWFRSPWQHVRAPIPQGAQGLVGSFEVTEDMIKKANVERLEHVQVTMNINHTRRGDLSVELISPEGLVSHLSATRHKDNLAAGYDDWTFMSVVHWGEPGIGKWTVIVKDTVVNEFSGELTDWRLTLWGEAIDPANQAMYPMPTAEDDADHDVDLPLTQSGSIGTTTVSVPPSTTLPEHPTDHPDRPVNQKPKPSSVIPSPPTVTTPAAPAEEEEEATKPSGTSASPVSSASASASPTESFFLPSIFPTFGVSPRTQIWIYGALGTILVFCIALGTYVCVSRRRRGGGRAGDRADYEFEMLRDNDEGERLTGVGAGAGGKTRRGGELYDAFASGSEDEGFFSDDDDDVDGVHNGTYRDEVEEKSPGATSSEDEEREGMIREKS